MPFPCYFYAILTTINTFSCHTKIWQHEHISVYSINQLQSPVVGTGVNASEYVHVKIDYSPVELETIYKRLLYNCNIYFLQFASQCPEDFFINTLEKKSMVAQNNNHKVTSTNTTMHIE